MCMNMGRRLFKNVVAMLQVIYENLHRQSETNFLIEVDEIRQDLRNSNTDP